MTVGGIHVLSSVISRMRAAKVSTTKGLSATPRFHLMRLTQRFFRLLAFGDRFSDSRLEILVELVKRRFGALARGDVPKEHHDLPAAFRLDAERGEFEMPTGRDKLALKTDRHAGAQDAAIEIDPPPAASAGTISRTFSPTTSAMPACCA